MSFESIIVLNIFKDLFQIQDCLKYVFLIWSYTLHTKKKWYSSTTECISVSKHIGQNLNWASIESCLPFSIIKLWPEHLKFACLFVLRFYGPVNPMGSCRARSVYQTTRLLGRLSPLSGWPILCTFFRQKLTTALLESAEGREWP